LRHAARLRDNSKNGKRHRGATIAILDNSKKAHRASCDPCVSCGFRGPNVAVMLLFVVSGVILACGQAVGRYLLLPASLVAQLNAWAPLVPS